MQFLHHGYLLLPNQRTPDLEILNSYFTVYFGSSPVDRTGTIKFPTRMKSIFPLPQMRNFSASYEEICHRRAINLVALANYLNTGIYVFWSGGVDSTCALACL